MAILVAVAALAVLKVVTTPRVIAVLVVRHVAAMTGAVTTAVVSVVVLPAVVVLLPVAVRALHLGKIVALLRAVTTKAMAASPALATTPRVALPRVVTWAPPVVPTVAILLPASLRLPSQLAASRLHPTMRASVLHAQLADALPSA